MLKEDLYADEIIRDNAERAIRSLSKELQKELAINDAQKNPNRRVHTALLVVRDEERFIALNGSAHQMEECFIELFKRRPDLRSVVQDVLNKMYRLVARI